MRNRIIYIALCFMGIGSCTKEIIVIPQDYTEKLVVHCNLNSDSFISVKVSKTNPISSNTGFNSVEDAIVDLYENGILMGTLTHVSTGEYKIGFKPRIKKEYFVEVTSVDLVCTAIDIVPDTVRIESLELDTVPFLSGQDFLQFTLEPSNNINLDEYYEVSALLNVREYIEVLGVVVDSVDVLRTVSLETIDPIILTNANNNNYREQFLVTDQSLGFKTAIKFGTYDIKELVNNEKALSVTLILKSMSEDAYDYYNSLYNQIYYRSDPFSLPVKVQSNIQNGYGIFGGVQETRVTVTF